MTKMRAAMHIGSVYDDWVSIFALHSLQLFAFRLWTESQDASFCPRTGYADTFAAILFLPLFSQCIRPTETTTSLEM